MCCAKQVLRASCLSSALNLRKVEMLLLSTAVLDTLFMSILFFHPVELREEIVKKMEKFLEPPPAKAVKALPKPDDVPRKKRGGKRYG